MSSMDKVFLILILVGGFWETEATSVTGDLGGDVTISCSHTNAEGNIKYFCKDPCKDKDVLIRSNDESKSRYSIEDKGNTFSVTISHLTEDDTGTYFCGIDRVLKDTFNKVVLTVIKGRTHDPDGDFSQSTVGEAFTTNAAHLAFSTNAAHLAFTAPGPTKSDSAEKLMYTGIGLGVVLLALAVVLLIFFKHRNGDISTSSGKYQKTDYASPSSLTGNNHDIITSSSSAKDDEATDGPKTSRYLSDELFYSCVNFNTQADRSSVTPSPAETTYSIITHMATDESAVYCNVSIVSTLSVTGSKGEDEHIRCVNAPVWQTAFLGGSVNINCSYPRAEGSTIKYFQRENESSDCTTLISMHVSPKTMKDRFSLTDHKEQGVYTVNIAMLRQEDTGRYRCVQSTVYDNVKICLTQIHLQIVNTDKIAKATHSKKTAQIECPYPDSHENNTKSLCKGEIPLNCEVLIQTTKGETKADKDRFSMRDNQRLKHFQVNINNLVTADFGTYWCGSDRKWHNASYTKINLLKEGRIKTEKSGPQQTTAAPSSTTTHHDDHSDSGRIGVMVVCLALLVIVGIVLIVFIHKLCRRQGGSTMQSTHAQQNSEENHNDRVYEEIKEPNQGASSEDTILTVYASANLPAEQLHYSSISFQQDVVTVSIDENPHPDMDKMFPQPEYSSVRMTQGGTQPSSLYSTVKNPEELK
ncbi:polymeric immunoglobulin receptor-like [Paralichthys olivaceus]|uniref:polymeric immunoglobulin receptor-like n=1 Tax=Paralichthys olivaceus TaxID=8255 RepID=UPI003752D00C